MSLFWHNGSFGGPVLRAKSSIPRIHCPYLASFTHVVRNQAKRSQQAGYQLKKSRFPHSAMSMFIMKRQCTCTLAATAPEWHILQTKVKL